MQAKSGARASPFGALLKHYRLAARLTQEELAEQARVSRLTISALERGVRHIPHKDTVRRLADALQLPARDRNRLEAAARRVGHEAAAFADEDHPSPGSLSPPLVDRGRELRLLEHHIEGEGPPLVVVAGEPGIGKTRLLHEAEKYAALYGLRVIRGSCQRRRRQDPYAPLTGALAERFQRLAPSQRRTAVRQRPWLARLLPELLDDLSEELPALSPEQERRLLFEAVAGYLTSPEAETAAGSPGTLLVLDDLQWAGPEALELLSSLARRPSGIATSLPGLRILGAYRHTEVGPDDLLAVTLADLVPGRLATQLPLGPLSREDAAELLDALLAGAEQQKADWILERASGVPFFLMSYAQALRAGTIVEKDGLPLDLAHSIRSRLAALPQEAREVLGAAAVIGRAVPHGVLLAVTGQAEDSVHRTLEAAQRAGLLVAEGDHLSRFAHEVIYAIVERDLPGARRAALHRRAAAALADEADQVPSTGP